MEAQILFELIMQIAETYPIFGDLVFWFGVIWLIMCLIINFIDLLAGIFKWNLDNKVLRVIKAVCEKIGPSLSIFGTWAKNRVAKHHKH